MQPSPLPFSFVPLLQPRLGRSAARMRSTASISSPITAATLRRAVGQLPRRIASISGMIARVSGRQPQRARRFPKTQLPLKRCPVMSFSCILTDLRPERISNPSHPGVSATRSVDPAKSPQSGARLAAVHFSVRASSPQQTSPSAGPHAVAESNPAPRTFDGMLSC